MRERISGSDYGKRKKMFTFAKATDAHLTSSPQTMSQKRETGVQSPATKETDWWQIGQTDLMLHGGQNRNFSIKERRSAAKAQCPEVALTRGII